MSKGESESNSLEFGGFLRKNVIYLDFLFFVTSVYHFSYYFCDQFYNLFIDEIFALLFR